MEIVLIFSFRSSAATMKSRRRPAIFFPFKTCNLIFFLVSVVSMPYPPKTYNFPRTVLRIWLLLLFVWTPILCCWINFGWIRTEEHEFRFEQSETNMEITWQKFPVGYFEIYLHWHNCQVVTWTTKKRARNQTHKISVDPKRTQKTLIL